MAFRGEDEDFKVNPERGIYVEISGIMEKRCLCEGELLLLLLCNQCVVIGHGLLKKVWPMAIGAFYALKRVP